MHVIAGAKEGGAESIMRDAVVALAEAGIAQHVVTRAYNRDRLDQFAARAIPVAIASFDKVVRASTDAAVRQAIAGFNPDVIHYWMGRAGTFAPKAQRGRSVGWYGGYYKLSRFRNCAWHAGMTRDIVDHIKGQGAPADRVVVLSSYANLANAAATPRASLDTPQGRPVVLALARLHWKKGLDRLLDAAAGIPGAYVWIAGSGPLEAELKAQAARLNIADRVRFLGWRDDRASLLAACDVVAFPSVFEPFGNVTIEAWAARKPLVVADAAGPAATVTHEVDALLVPKGNATALRSALSRVICEPGLAQRLVDGGSRAYAARFTKTAFVKASLKLYERMMASSRELGIKN
jgi:glycosyltransferase involved in cell wall biosynthesis